MTATWHIRVKRATASTWSDTNPILGLGEVGYATDVYEVRVGDGTSHWNDLLPPRGNNGAANVIMHTPSLTPENGDVLSVRWYSPGSDGEGPIPANWQDLNTYTWNGTYSQPDQRVLLMVGDDTWPSVYAYVTPDGFLPLALNAGQIVTVQCGGAAIGSTPSIWIGANSDDTIGEGDPRTLATSFYPPSITSGQVWSDAVQFDGTLASQGGNNLTQILQWISGLGSGVYEAFLTLGYDFDATTGTSGIAVNGQVNFAPGNHIFIPIESNDQPGIYVVGDGGSLTRTAALFDGNHNGSIVWSYHLLASANGKVISTDYPDRFIYGVYTSEFCNVVPLHTPPLVVDAYVTDFGEGVFTVQNLDGTQSTYPLSVCPSLYQFHHGGFLYDVIEGSPTVNWGEFLGSGIIKTEENDATPGCGGLVLFTENSNYTILNQSTPQPRYIVHWYGSISTDSPTALSDLTARTLSPQFGGKFSPITDPRDQHEQIPLDGDLVAIDEADETFQFNRCTVWRMHDGVAWEKMPIAVNDWVLFDNCSQINASTVLMSYSQGEILAHWNPIDKNWLDLAYGDPIDKMGDPLLRAMVDPKTTNLMRLVPDMVLWAGAVPLTNDLVGSLARTMGSSGPVARRAEKYLGAQGWPNLVGGEILTRDRMTPPLLPEAWSGLHVVGPLFSGQYHTDDPWLTDTLELEVIASKLPQARDRLSTSDYQEMTLTRTDPASDVEWGVVRIGLDGDTGAGHQPGDLLPGWHLYLDYAETDRTPHEWVWRLPSDFDLTTEHHYLCRWNATTGAVSVTIDDVAQSGVPTIPTIDGFSIPVDGSLTVAFINGWHGPYFGYGPIGGARLREVDIRSGFSAGDTDFSGIGWGNGGTQVMAAPDSPQLWATGNNGYAISDPTIVNIPLSQPGGWSFVFRGTFRGGTDASPETSIIAGMGGSPESGLPGYALGADFGGLTGGSIHWAFLFNDGTITPSPNPFAQPGVKSGTPLPTDECVIVINIDDDHQVTGYVNGSQAGSPADLTGLGDIVCDLTSFPLLPIARTNCTYAAVIRRALSADEIASLSADPVIPTIDDLIGIADLFPPTGLVTEAEFEAVVGDSTETIGLRSAFGGSMEVTGAVTDISPNISGPGTYWLNPDGPLTVHLAAGSNANNESGVEATGVVQRYVRAQGNTQTITVVCDDNIDGLASVVMGDQIEVTRRVGTWTAYQAFPPVNAVAIDISDPTAVELLTSGGSLVFDATSADAGSRVLAVDGNIYTTTGSGLDGGSAAPDGAYVSTGIPSTATSAVMALVRGGVVNAFSSVSGLAALIDTLRPHGREIIVDDTVGPDDENGTIEINANDNSITLDGTNPLVIRDFAFINLVRNDPAVGNTFTFTGIVNGDPGGITLTALGFGTHSVRLQRINTSWWTY